MPGLRWELVEAVLGGVCNLGTTFIKTDLLGREVEYKDESDTLTTTTYDRTGRVTSEATNVNGYTLTVSYTYDQFGRPVSTKINGILASTVTYNAAGEMNTITYNHGVAGATTTATIGRDDRQGQIGSVAYQFMGSAMSESVTRSQSGRIKTHTTGGATWGYIYDSVGRLVSGVRGSDSFTYSYDDDSNRLTANLDGTAVSYNYSNSIDRLTSFTGSGTIGYDSHGNTTSIDGLLLTWDGADRNTGISKPGTTVTYTRDSQNRVKTRSENGAVTRYLYSGSGDAPIAITAPGSQTVAEFYIGLPGGVVRTVNPWAPDVWLFPNLHGDTLATVNAAGEVVGGPFSYGPYGEQVGGGQADQTYESL